MGLNSNLNVARMLGTTRGRGVRGVSAKTGGGKYDAIIVTGDDVVDRKLQGMHKRFQKKLIRKATRKATKEIVLPEAKVAAPGYDQNRIAKSLIVRALKRSRTRIGHEVKIKKDAFDSDNFWPAALEFGTKNRVHKSTGKFVGKIQKNEFAYLRRSLYGNEGRIRRLFEYALLEAIREETDRRTPEHPF